MNKYLFILTLFLTKVSSSYAQDIIHSDTTYIKEGNRHSFLYHAPFRARLTSLLLTYRPNFRDYPRTLLKRRYYLRKRGNYYISLVSLREGEYMMETTLYGRSTSIQYTQTVIVEKFSEKFP